MDHIVIKGPCKLNGAVNVSSSKNAALPILAATLLYPGEVELQNLPGLSDVGFFLKILNSLGASSKGEGTVKIDASSVDCLRADYDLVRKMRASVLVLGPLLSRFGKAEVSLPGGCAIGSRPVDIHLDCMEKMGAKISIEKGYIIASCEAGLQGTQLVLPFPSVGATENLMMAAAYANGETIIDNAAREPEIEDLAKFMIGMGFEVMGAGTSTITIKGKLKSEIGDSLVSHEIIGDRIEAATYVIAGLITNSQITVNGFNPKHITGLTQVLESMGAKLEIGEKSIKTMIPGRLKGTRVETAPYPGFPTDAQAQLMALMGVCQGDSQVSEQIFENRFMHVPELGRMGYDISVDGRTAHVKGGSDLSGAPVMCTDLRASAALVLAGLKAEGETIISRIYHLDRGYEDLARKLASLGANIKRKTD